MAPSPFSRSSPRASNALRRRSAPGAAYAPWGWALAGALLGGGGALLAALPAHWMAAGVERASGAQLQLAAARGSVWNGSAQLVLAGGSESQSATA